MAIDLSSFMVVLPHGRLMSMADLASGWCAHVERLRDEAVGTAKKESWGAHDLIAALTLRSFIAQGLSGRDSETVEAVMAHVTPADESYLEFTVLDSEKVVRAFGEQPEVDEQWWWDRLPAEGPAHDELIAWLRESP